MARWPFNSAAWRHARLAVLRRDGGLCQIRGPKCLGAATEADHNPTPLAVILDTYGGQHTAEALRAATDPQNLRSSCKSCNASNGARLGAARRWGTTPRRRRRPSIRRVSREW